MRADHTPQPQLEGMPPAPTGRHRAAVLRDLDAGHPLKLAVLGALLRDAAVRETTSGGVALEVLVAQQLEHHPTALPLYAAQWFPPEAGLAQAFDDARALARRLTAGTEVMVLGRGLERGRAQGEDVLRLIHTIGVRPAAEISLPTEGTHAH
jgi:hypothetical protein